MFTTDIYSAVSSVITGPLSFLYVVILTLQWRFSSRTMRFVIPAVPLLQVIGSTICFCAFGINDSTKLQVAFYEIIVVVVFNLSCSRYPLLQMLSTYTTACIFTFICDTVCGILVPQPGLLHVFAKIGIFLGTAALLTGFFCQPLLEVQREIQRKKWLWMMIVPFLMCLIFFYVVQMQGPLYEDPAFRPVVLALCFCAVSVYICFYFVLRSLQRQYQMQSEAAVLEVHLSAIKKHAETMKTMSDEICCIRHDLRHYVHMQSVCLENGDMDGMREALSSITKHVSEPEDVHRMRQYTGQTLIDAVLSYYADRAVNLSTAFQVHFQLPEDFQDLSEFAVMLSNALENACNACEALSADREREIKLTGGVEGEQFLLEIANTYSGEVSFDSKGRPVTRKQGHGYGTQSIITYVEKHHAQLYYQTENGWFRLRLMMENRGA